MHSESIHCPYCGEPLEVEVDCSVKQQEYIEDCQVCCRPMTLRVTVDDDQNTDIAVRAESD